MTRVEQRQAVDQGNEINVTPMLDVVFILLIFFIVTTSFQKETALELRRPAASAQPDVTSKVWVVRIDAMDRVSVNQRHIDLEAISVNAVQWRSSLGTDDGAGGALIVTSPLASTGVLVQVADQLRQAGLREVSVTQSNPSLIQP